MKLKTFAPIRRKAAAPAARPAPAPTPIFGKKQRNPG